MWAINAKREKITQNPWDMLEYWFNRGSTRLVWFNASEKIIQPSSAFPSLYRDFYDYLLWILQITTYQERYLLLLLIKHVFS